MVENYTKLFLFSDRGILLEYSNFIGGEWRMPLIPVIDADRFVMTRDRMRDNTGIIIDGFSEHGKVRVYNGVPDPLQLTSIISSRSLSGSLKDDKNYMWLDMEHPATSDLVNELDLDILSRVLDQKRFDLDVHVDAEGLVLGINYVPTLSD